MADVSITAANVLPGDDAVIEHGTYGATVTQGQVVYQDSADKKLKLADNDHAAAAVRGFRGIALNAGANGQPGSIQRSGDITIGGPLVAGTTYCLSSTAGGICPQADVASGDEVIVIGVAKSTSVLTIRAVDTGVTL